MVPLVVLAFAVSAAAQTDLNWGELTGTCTVLGPQLTAELEIVTELPAAWVGWVVVRTTLGVCEPVAQVHGPVSFPVDGRRSYSFIDQTAEPGQAYKYHLRAADGDGNLYYLGTGGTFPPGYYQTAFATCEDAVAARGRLTNQGLPWGLELCPDQCWESTWFVSELPPELEPLVGTDAVVELRGTIADEFEGPYIATVTGWTILGDCGTVPTVPGSWSGLKATYR